MREFRVPLTSSKVTFVTYSQRASCCDFLDNSLLNGCWPTIFPANCRLMSGAVAKRKSDQPRDFLAAGLVCMFWGVGFSFFLSITETWFGGVSFYFISPSIVAIALITIGVLCLIASISAPKPVRVVSQNILKRGVYAVGLLLWILLGASYRLTPDFQHLSEHHELARAYSADPGCSADRLIETVKRGPPPLTTAPRATASLCQLGWTTVSEKTGAGNCLVLSGGPMSGAYCTEGRGRPPCDWGNIQVGDATVAETFNLRPAGYFCPTIDPISIPFFGRGVVIQTSGNPVREYQLMIINRLLVLGLYLLFGTAILYRAIR